MKRRAGVDSRDQQIAAGLRDRGYDQNASDYLNCGDPALTRCVKVCSNDPGHFNRPVGFSCHLRICPECCHKDGARLLKQYLAPFQAAAAAAPKGYALRHVVLTTSYWLHDPDIRKRYHQIYKDADQLFEYFFGKNWQRSDRGLIYAAEFGEDGLRLHLHALVMCEYIDQEALSAKWKQITGNPIVWIRRVQGIRKAVKEMVKYVTHLKQLEPLAVVAAFECIKGSRRIRSRGIFFGLPAPVVEKITNCKHCGSAIIQISAADFAAFQASQKNRDSERGTLLHSIIGNKSAHAPPETENAHRVYVGFEKWNNATNGLEDGFTMRTEDVQ